MKCVANIIKQLQVTSSTNDKISILKSNLDNETLKKVLLYTLDPFKKYKITEQVYDKTEWTKLEYEVDFFNFLDELSSSNINDLSRSIIKSIIESEENEDVRELYKLILFKDLKCNIGDKVVNKVWKGLIPAFNVMLAESLAKQKDSFLNGKEFAITTKLDGNRMVYMPNTQQFISRQGQQFEGLDHLLHECINLSQGKYVLDGELIHRNYDNLPSDELYRLTMKVSRKKGNTPEKRHLEFHIFDIIPIEEFVQGESSMRYYQRMEVLDGAFDNALDLDFAVQVKPLYVGEDQNVIPELLSSVTEQGGEGLMLNLTQGTYQCKRSKNILKVKKFEVADVIVDSVYEGTGNFKGTLGGINVRFKHDGELYECGVGSGFTQEQRHKYWSNPNLLIGNVCEIQYFEVSSNQDGGKGLRFPVYLDRIRHDKTIDDITETKTN